ncbi:hypothetical protein JTE90_007851 [Oedothorax gibbosus]|uniref:Uncharacterized protein n=1 Tax=Oedothorax gibbosus TaxID=931172 RepID=A0AAV6VJ97_9ARAC|nr:hypothetical protein JTE90_007851 [Oedothorax gibbosus]
MVQCFTFHTVQGQSSTDHGIDWYAHLLHPSSQLIFQAHRHVRAQSFNNTMQPCTSVPTEKNNDVWALVLYAVLSVLGTTDIFEISSLIIQENLRHHGKVFLANQAMSNLLITTLGFPASSHHKFKQEEMEVFISLTGLSLATLTRQRTGNPIHHKDGLISKESVCIATGLLQHIIAGYEEERHICHVISGGDEPLFDKHFAIFSPTRGDNKLLL